MKSKDFATGCPALAESYKLDALPGTLFTLAECEAGAGHSASALLHYGDFVAAVQAMPADAQKKQQPRIERTQQQRKALEKTVPHLTLTLPKDAPAGATVKRDGKAVPAAVFGVAVAVDPGEHVVVTEAPQRTAKEQKVVVTAGKDETMVLAFGPTTAAKPDEKPVATTAEPAAPPPPAEESTGRPTLGYVALGVGGAFLVAGGVTGALALGKKGDVDDNCQGAVCNAKGKDAGDSLKTYATISNVGFGVGIVGVAVGTVLLLRAPKKTTAFTVAPTLAIGGSRDAFGGLVGRF